MGIGGSVSHGEDAGMTLKKLEGDQQCLRGNGKNGVLEWEWEETQGWIFAFWQGRHWRTCGTSENGKISGDVYIYI